MKRAMMGLVVERLFTEQAEAGLLRDFDTWMASEQRRVYALCQRLLQDRDEADSATQASWAAPVLRDAIPTRGRMSTYSPRLRCDS